MANVQRGLITRNDVALYDGVTRTASRKDATGGTVTGLNFGDEVDVLQVFGDGTSRSSATIRTAIGRLGGANATLLFSTGTWTITDDLTIPSNVTCHVPSGTIFSVSSGITLTISGYVFTEKPNNWTAGPGTVAVSIEGPHFGIWHSSAFERTASSTIVNFQFKHGHVYRYGSTVAESFGTIPTADASSEFRAAIKTLHKVLVPEGAFRILPSSNVGLSISSSTISNSFTNQSTVVMEGAGQWKTELWFDTAVESDVFIDLTNSSNYSGFRGIRFRPGTEGKATALRITDDLSTGAPNWKNRFDDCRFEQFFIGCRHTSTDPLDGSTHAWASETKFDHCKFKNCRTTFLNENIQAVNLTLVATDIENDDSSEQYVMFKDFAGGEVKTYGGSFIGAGPILQWELPTGGTNLFAAGKFSMNGGRIEARSTHYGVLFEQLDTTLITSQFMNIHVRDVQINGFTQDIDLMQYGGRCIANFRDSMMFNGTFTVRQYPTDGFTSGSQSVGSQSRVNVDNCGHVFMEKATSSAYGTYDAQRTGPVVIQQSNFSTNGNSEVDAQGFTKLRTHGPVTHFGYGWQAAPGPQECIFNDDDITAGFFAASDPSGLKLIVPKYSRCRKFIAYKHPQRYASAHVLNFYYVKDNANWVDTGNFAVGTDAVKCAIIPDTVNSAGYFTQPIVLTANSFGTELRAGFGSWTEGRIYIERAGATSTWIGYVGVEIS